MRGILTALWLSLAPAPPAVAETAAGHVLDGPGFARAVEGWTVVWGRNGMPYGVEQYRPGNRVTWSFEDGSCITGRWWAGAQGICFAYEGGAPLCWTAREGPAGLRVWVTGDPDPMPLTELSRHRAPLRCPAPNLGS